MNIKNPVFATIAVSLIFSAAIVVASTLLQGHESADTVTWILRCYLVGSLLAIGDKGYKK